MSTSCVGLPTVSALHHRYVTELIFYASIKYCTYSPSLEPNTSVVVLSSHTCVAWSSLAPWNIWWPFHTRLLALCVEVQIRCTCKEALQELVLKSFASGIILAVLVVTASLFSNFAPHCGVVLGVALCVLMIQFVRVPSLKISTLLLLGLLVYDVFWVGTVWFTLCS